MAGGAADCSFWERVLAMECRSCGEPSRARSSPRRKYELANKERISVAAASKMLANMVARYKGMGLSMVSPAPAALRDSRAPGHDDCRLGQEGAPLHCMWRADAAQGPGLFYVDGDGTRLSNDLFSVGSGSPYAYGVLDRGYKWDLEGGPLRWDAPRHTVQPRRRMIWRAGPSTTPRSATRTAAAPSTVRVGRAARRHPPRAVYHMKQTGWVKVSADDVMKLHYQYAAEKSA